MNKTEGDNSNVIPLPSPKAVGESPRRLTEAEVRGGFFAAMEAIQYARRTVARWNLRGKKPTSDEMLRLAQSLHGFEKAVTEQIAGGPETDGHALDARADFFRQQIEMLDSSDN